MKNITSIIKNDNGHSSIIEEESKTDVIYRAWKWESIRLTAEGMSEAKLY